MRNLLLLLLAAASGLANATPTSEIEGTWKYADADSFFQVRLERGGGCYLGAGTSSTSSAFAVQCTYELYSSYVDVHWVRDDEGNQPRSLRLFLVAGGDVMRVEGEFKRPLLRVRDEAAPPLQVNLSEPGAMSALEARDPTGHRKVAEMIDFVRKYGCRGAALGHVKSLVRIDFVGCGPPETLIGFWLGDGRYVVHIPAS